jgi:hypothetical protein
MSSGRAGGQLGLRTLAITQNITVDGSIEMLGDWFDPQGQAEADRGQGVSRRHRVFAIREQVLRMILKSLR